MQSLNPLPVSQQHKLAHDLPRPSWAHIKKDI